ncbi:hypothetical protein LY78DRAFT_368882 [Colletotrichum sublineola]|nr:hypothetical protein LY78DRAFT_368882 [Colletotrichum sublineola]
MTDRAFSIHGRRSILPSCLPSRLTQATDEESRSHQWRRRRHLPDRCRAHHEQCHLTHVSPPSSGLWVQATARSLKSVALVTRQSPNCGQRLALLKRQREATPLRMPPRRASSCWFTALWRPAAGCHLRIVAPVYSKNGSLFRKQHAPEAHPHLGCEK